MTYGGSSPAVHWDAFAMKEFLEQNAPADWIVFGTSSEVGHMRDLYSVNEYSASRKSLRDQY